jgi:hypothetical protein
MVDFGKLIKYSDYWILQVFNGPTKLFSEANVPLIADAIPMLDTLEATMVNIRDATLAPLPNVIRVAAEAALLLIDKYFSLTDECELYQIAIGKLQQPLKAL